MPARIEIARDASDRLVELAQDRAISLVPGLAAGRNLPVGIAVDDAIDAGKEAPHALHALILPVQIAIRRRGEQRKHASGVGAVSFNQILWADHVAQVL